MTRTQNEWHCGRKRHRGNKERQTNSHTLIRLFSEVCWDGLVLKCCCLPQGKSSLGHILEEIWLLGWLVATSWDLEILLHLSTQLLCNYVVMELQCLSDVCSGMYALVLVWFKGTVSLDCLCRPRLCSLRLCTVQKFGILILCNINTI